MQLRAARIVAVRKQRLVWSAAVGRLDLRSESIAFLVVTLPVRPSTCTAWSPGHLSAAAHVYALRR